MRLGYGLTAVALLALCSGLARAKDNEDKPWHYDPYDVRATFPETEPNNTCATANQVTCGDVVSPAALNPGGDLDWYTFTATAGTQLTIGTDVVNAGDGTDTYIELYRNDCTTLLASDDDAGPGFYSLISNFPAPYTGVYNLKVRGYNSSSTGPYKMFLTCTVPQPPPPNDRCDGALVIDRCTSGTRTGDNTLAINDYDPSLPGPSCTGYSAAGKDVTYKVSLQVGDVIDVTYTAVADGSVYLVRDCANISSSCVIGADATLSGQAEHFNYSVTIAGVYFLILDSYGTNTGTTWTLVYTITCPPPTGACCFPDGSCTVTTATQCQGHYQGDGTTCNPNPCPQPPPRGACCFPDGTCQVLLAAQCQGQYMGDNTTCDPNPCPQPPPRGACCIPGAPCFISDQSSCLANGGVYFGDGSTCNPDPCSGPPTGACCFNDGSCVVLTGADCESHNGNYQGDGTSCDPNPCPQPEGACCFPDGSCQVYTMDRCNFFEGSYQGDGTDCVPNPCPQPPGEGACCLQDGTCLIYTQDLCDAYGGSYQGDGTLCEPNPCNPPVPTERKTWGSVKHHYR